MISATRQRWRASGTRRHEQPLQNKLASFLCQSIELARKIKEEDKPGSRGCHLASDSGPRGTSGRKPEASQSNGMRTPHRLGMRPIYEFFFYWFFFPAEDRISSKEICSQNSEIRGNEEEFYALLCILADHNDKKQSEIFYSSLGLKTDMSFSSVFELTFRVPYRPVPPLAKLAGTSRSALFRPSMNALVFREIPVRLAGIRQ